METKADNKTVTGFKEESLGVGLGFRVMLVPE